MRTRSPSRRIGLLLLALCVFIGMAEAQIAAAPLPEIRQNGAVKALFVDNKPVHHGVRGTPQLHRVKPGVHEAHLRSPCRPALNTVIVTVSWELTEPEEGRFDFSLVDA